MGNSSSDMEEDAPSRSYDVFLSHAGEQKLSCVDGIWQCLTAAGLDVFLDEPAMAWSLSGGQESAKTQALDACMNCAIGVVILSRDFVRKNWVMQELRLLLRRQQQQPPPQLQLIPVLYGLEDENLLQLSRKLCSKDAGYADADKQQLLAWADTVKQLALSEAGKQLLCVREQSGSNQLANAVVQRVLELRQAPGGLPGWAAGAGQTIALTLVPLAGTDLIARHQELEQAWAALTGQQRCVWLHGPGGVGKTLMARRLVEQMCHGWGHGGDVSARFAFEVDLQEMGQGPQLKELVATKMMKTVHRSSSQWDTLCSWLRAQAAAKVVMVFENADHCSHLKEMYDALADLHSLPNVHLIIVSRSRCLTVPSPAEHSIVAVQLQPLSVEASINLLEKRLNSPLKMWSCGESLECVQQLVEAVGGVPLMLELAAALVRSQRATWNMLLEGLMQASPQSGYTDSCSMASSKTIFDDQLCSVAALCHWLPGCLTEAEQHVLASLAAVGSGFTPGLAVALNPDMEPNTVVSMLQSLQAAALLQEQPVPSCPHGLPALQCGSRYVMPRLVREAVWQLHSLFANGSIAASMTLALLQPLEAVKDCNSKWFVDSMADAATKQLVQMKSDEASSFAASVTAASSRMQQMAALETDDWEAVPAALHHLAVQAELVRQLLEEILAVRAVLLGVDHTGFLRSIDLLLAAMDEVGQLDDRVCGLQELATSIRCSSLGPEHVETIASKSALARQLSVLGQLDAAKELQQEVLAIRAATLGQEHPLTLASLADLAATLRQTGELAAARKLQEDVVALSMRLLGPEHTDTVAAKGKLASVLSDVGELRAAKQLAEEVLTAWLKSLGSHHQDTLASKNNLGVILGDLGQLREARQLQEEVLADCSKLFGAEHTFTLTSMANLASTLVGLGELGAARRLQEAALATCRKVLGRRHHSTLAGMSNLASTLCATGSFGEAKELLEEVVDTWTCLLGGAHSDTLASKSNLASVLKEQGQLRAARRLQEQVLEGCKQALGADHPLTLTSTNNLADTLRALGELQKARKLDKEVLESRTRVLGSQHPDTLSCKSNMASTLHSMGKLPEARALLTEVLVELTAALGPEHPATLACKNNLASTLTSLKLPAQAKGLQEEVLAAYGRVLGPEHPDTLISKNNLSLTLAGLGELGEARRMQQEVLACRMRTLGPQHPDTLCSRNLLAATLKKA